MFEAQQYASFRRILHAELPQWVAEGLLSEEAADALRSRYAQDADSDSSMQRLLVVSIYTIGALLVGGGVISFVAANWALIPAAAKVTLLLSAMVGFHGLGYYWAFLRGSRPALGQAFLVLGTVVFGANIGLFSQIFHLEGHVSTGFSVWALGAAAMAFATGSIPTAALTIIVAFIAFQGGMRTESMLLAYPLLIWFGGLGFAHFYRAPFIAVLSLLAGGYTAAFYSGINQNWGFLVITGLLISILYVGLGILSRQDAPGITAAPADTGGLARIFPRMPGAYRLGIAGILFLIYLLSFGGVASEAVEVRTGRSMFFRGIETGYGPYLLFGIIVVAAVGVWALVYRSGRLFEPERRELTWTLAASALLPSLLIALGRWIQAMPFDDIIMLVANVALFALSAVFLRQGMASADRSSFWVGLAVLGLTIVSRFFEYDTGLLIKSLVFIVCGVAVLACGLVFEKRLRGRETLA